MTLHISFTRLLHSTFLVRAQKCLIRKKEQNGDHRPANIVTFVVRAHTGFSYYYWIGQQIWAHYRLNGVCIYEVTSLSLLYILLCSPLAACARHPRSPPSHSCMWMGNRSAIYIRILFLLLFYRHPCDVHRKSWFLKNALDPWRTSFLWSDDFLNRLAARAVNANFLCARSRVSAGAAGDNMLFGLGRRAR